MLIDMDYADSSPAAINSLHLDCLKCSYDLAGCDPRGNCPECGTPIIDGCIVCAYDLSATDPDSNCPECGTPVVHSIGRSAFAGVPTKALKSVHLGFRIVTYLILLCIAAIVCLIAFMFSGVFLIASSDAVAWVLAGLGLYLLVCPYGVMFGWFKLSRPLEGLHPAIDAPARRKRLRRSLLGFAVALVLFTVISITTISLWIAPDDLVLRTYFLGTQLALFVMSIFLFVTMVMYMGWFACMVRNKKMYRRSRHLIWSGPLIAIVGFPLLFLGPLITLILYWNMIEYTRRDLKKIIAARA